MSGEPNLYTDSDLDEILADKDKRIAELEAAIRKITFQEEGGAVRPSFYPYVDLATVAPILADVHKSR